MVIPIGETMMSVPNSITIPENLSLAPPIIQELAIIGIFICVICLILIYKTQGGKLVPILIASVDWLEQHQMKYNSKLEKAIFRLIGIKVKPCGQYDRLEQCCNDPNYSDFCDKCCPNGTGGEAFLPFSKLLFNLEGLWSYMKMRDYK